ncbi:MAG: serine/threonine protein kinase [Planctomycetia bacterium]|nr:serine/threonine protein kinase [Planctomycetia bacterium]
MLIGQTIGPFKIEKELGSGAMGTVYRATFSKDDTKQRRVAIKVIAPGLGDNERIQARFEREATILKQLKHPNIVRLLATGKFQGRPFYAMEYIEGYSLDHQLATKGRIHWEKLIELGKQICASLQHAHDHGIIHRDLKPSNLMIDRHGNVKLTDFGIAKDSDMSGLTSANSTVGTAAYMSPEQCRGERDLTPKSDLYALGIVFYELLTGRKPFAAENAMDMFIQHVSGTFERPARIVMDIPPWMDTLVCQLMEKKPEHRPADARTVAQALDEVRQRVESHKSLGAELANKVARKGDGKDKQLAEEIVAGKKIKKRKEKAKVEFRKQLLAAAGISVLLIGVVFMIIYAMQGPGPVAMLNSAVKKMEKFDAALMADTSDSYKVFEYWEDARTELEKLRGKYPESKEATIAKEHLEFLEAGNYYRLGKGILGTEPVSNWGNAYKKGYEKLYELKTPASKTFVDRARKEIMEYHAPVLLAESKAKADIDKESDWPEAIKKLTMVQQFYPESPSFPESMDLLNRLLAHQTALEQLKKKDILNNPEWKRTASKFEYQAVLALNDELQAQPEAAIEKWKILKEEGFKQQDEKKKFVDNPQYRPWIQLAQAKLEAFSKSGSRK